MFSTLRTRFGIPGVISTIALVFAMTGGAFAAKYLITSTKQISPSVLKKLKGAAGPAGAAGAQGPAGPAGTAGAAGEAGAKGVTGATGTNGTNGTNGVSVTSTTEPPGANCTNGGVKFTSASGNSFACNGAPGTAGAAGPEGSPWTVNAVLPSGKTLTGAWATSVDTTTSPLPFSTSPISFPIPLAAEVAASNRKIIQEGGTPPAECDNGAGAAPSPANPEADPGFLCIYVTTKSGTGVISVSKAGGPPGFGGASVSGAIVGQSGVAGDAASGTWAVTAP